MTSMSRLTKTQLIDKVSVLQKKLDGSACSVLQFARLEAGDLDGLSNCLISELAGTFGYGLVMEATGKLSGDRLNMIFSEISGYSVEEISELGEWKALIYPDDMLHYRRHFNKLITGHGDVLEFRIICKDGSLKWVRDIGRPQKRKGAHAQLIILGVLQDVNDFKEAEYAQSESQDNFRLLAENAHDGLIIIDSEFRLVYANQRIAVMAGSTVEALHNCNVDDIIHVDEKINVNNYLKSIIARLEVPFQFQTILVRNDGVPVPVELSAAETFWEGQTAVAAIVRDIAERKMQEQVLKDTLERYRALFDRSTSWVFIYDFRGTILEANGVMLSTLGYSKNELGQIKIAELLDRGEYAKFETDTEKLKKAGKQEEPVEYTVRKKDGGTICIESEASVIYEKGKPIAIQGIARDITERKKAEESLYESEEKYREVVERTNDGICIIQDMQIAFANTTFARMLEYNVEELTAKKLLDCIEPDSAQSVASTISSFFNDRKKALRFEATFVSKSGTKKDVELNVSYIQFEGKPAALGFIRDITEKRQIEKELQNSQKFESIGVLAGGIAHDFNNILTAILGNISLGLTEAEKGTKIYDSLQSALKASKRARNLTQQLITFSKGGSPVMQTTSIADVVRDSAHFALHGANVVCSFELEDNLWKVAIDTGQISQVINNLVLNAAQAMPDGGTVDISVANVRLKKGEVVSLRAGRYIKIVIKDTGSGIDDKDLPKIFDPFFSTRQSSSGLGLATCYSIIKQHKGHISVESTVGKGSAFSILLPATENDEVESQNDTDESVLGSGNILLMDDDPIVLKVAVQILSTLGYTVASAVNGQEATEVFKAARDKNEPFDAVILDLTIVGGMGGVETLKKLKELDPNVKAIVSSGYSNVPVMANYREYGFVDCMAKPYVMADLSKKLLPVLKEK
ncbi:MAG: PAS domain S-box protein [Chitinivibrionales bacterium]|nr:PAS domain S-box protein [Chitinivibrionales bacterium]